MLEQEQDYGLAHATMGLLLLGMGALNFGAISVCRLHQQQAIPYRLRAVQPVAGVVQARQVLEFCREELSGRRRRGWRPWSQLYRRGLPLPLPLPLSL